MKSLQCELAQLELAGTTEQSNAKERVSTVVSEKQRAEERLKIIIQRCEMYVQRHQMLKRMGIKMKRKEPEAGPLESPRL